MSIVLTSSRASTFDHTFTAILANGAIYLGYTSLDLGFVHGLITPCGMMSRADAPCNDVIP